MIHLARQSGYILLPVVVVITLVAAIALSMTTESSLESNTAASELDAQRAQYVATAGLNHGQWLTRQQGCGPYNDLTAQSLDNDSYSASLTTDLGTTTAYSAGVDQDTGIVSLQPDVNNGGSVDINIAFDGANEERGLTRFDLTALPQNASIVSAQARFYVDVGHPAGAINLHQVVTDWSESDASWNKMNDRFAEAVLVSIPPQPVSGVWVSVNLTSLVQSWVNGEPNYGVMLKSATPNINAKYSSRESVNPPVLDVIVGIPPSSPATLTATGTLGNGVSRQLVREDIVLVQQPGYLQLQPGPASGKDSYLYEWKPTWNYGASNRIWVEDRFAFSRANGLLRFDIAAVPAGALITSAVLELYQANNSLIGGNIGVYHIDNGWREGTHSGAMGTANWSERDDTNAWATVGGDFGATRYAQQTLPVGSGWAAWEIGELVNGWVSGRIMNHGLALYAESFGTAAHFASSDDTDPALRPKLSITYACTCDQVCLAPQGSGNLLMVVINPTTLVPEDAYKKALFESLGYSVSVISESANQTTYDAMIAVNDVVFISETVNSIQVGSRLVDAPIGVVSQDGDYNADLGFSASSAWTVGSTIDIVSTDHYITRPFTPGPLDIYRGGMEQLTVAGIEAAGLQVLAQSSGAGSLVTLDSGDTLENGGTAAGRRVMLPLGRESALNWGQLSSDGLLLVQRALTWGAGREAIKLNPQLLLVVVDPAALTAQEGAKKSLIQSWGYDVNLIDDGASQADFDAAVAIADVAYVAEDITSGTLGTKLRDATIGVVIEEEKITDEFGISSGDTSFTETSIEIADNTHYITQPFSPGPVAFASSVQPVGGRAGTLAPGLEILALRPSSATSMLDVIDAGGALFDTGTAAGRRVKLPWGGNDFDINSLTDDGRTVMRRAIEWAGSVSTGTTPIAHWKLDEGTGPTAIDSEGGHDGTLSNGPVWGAGRIDGGLAFDGSDDFIDVPHQDTLLLTAGMTFTAWAQTLEIGGGNKAIVSKDTPGNGASNYWFGIENDELVFGFWASGAFRTVKTTAVDLSTGSWHHLAASFDNASDVVRLYVDGIEVQTGSITFEPTTETANLFIGKSVDGEFWHGSLDDVRIYDTVLNAEEIASLYKKVPIILSPYEETHLSWTANNDNVWEIVDLAALGVPPNAVVEVAVINTDSVRERGGGVRAVGSSLDRRLMLHEAESGGTDVMVMHVQADAASQIEHFSESNAKVSFILLGYWRSGSFVESWNNFTAAGDFSWGNVALSAYGVPPDAVVEVLLHNDNGDFQFRGGIRRSGSTVQRLINLHEAESGGNEIATMLVTAGSDAAASIEVYSESVSNVDFFLSGYWDNPPGAFTDTFTEIVGLPAASSSWEDASLAAFGVPADTVVSILVVNSHDTAEAQLGVRRKGSSLARNLELHEAEPMGGDFGSMHAVSDGVSAIQLYDQNTTQDHRFYLMGWWDISP